MKNENETDEEYEERKRISREHQRKLKTGEWIDESPLTDKKVICYRCLTVYHLRQAPRVMNNKVEVKDPVCPNCNCKVYFS